MKRTRRAKSVNQSKGSTHSVHRREQQFLRCVPEALECGSLLYIGAKVKRMEMLNLFTERGVLVDVLEIWPKNALELVVWNAKRGVLRNILVGDVRDLALKAAYDVVMWWHGPEHVGPDEIEAVLECVERAARAYVIMAGPDGEYKQGEAYGNPHEAHLTTLTAEFFEERGYHTDRIGNTSRVKPNKRVLAKRDSNLLAWKRVGG